MIKLKTLGRKTFAVLATVASMAVPAQADTLADALVGAYNHSGLLDQNRALLRAADEDVAVAAAALLPVISWSAEVARGFSDNESSIPGFSTGVDATTTSVSLLASQQLFDGGADAFRIAAAKEQVLATRALLVSIEQRVLGRAVQAYMGVVRAIENVTLRQNNLRLLTEELRAARDRFDVGEVTRTDVALAEAQLAQARSGLAGAQGDLIVAREEYRDAVGRYPGAIATPPRLPRVTTNIPAAKAVARVNHPDLEQAQHQVASNEALIRAAKADLSPTISLEGRLTLQETFESEANRRDGSIGLSMQQTIYNGGRLSSLIRRAMAVRDASRANLHVVSHAVEANVGTAIANFVAAGASLEASRRQVRAARVAFRGIREEAKLGARTTLDVLDAEQNLLDAQAAVISAQADQYIAAYNVLASQGLLTAESLDLPVTVYDATEYYNLVKDGVAQRTRQGRQLDRVLRALQKD